MPICCNGGKYLNIDKTIRNELLSSLTQYLLVSMLFLKLGIQARMGLDEPANTAIKSWLMETKVGKWNRSGDQQLQFCKNKRAVVKRRTTNPFWKQWHEGREL